MKRIYLVTGSIILLLLLVGVLFAWQKTVKAPEIIPTPKPTPTPVAVNPGPTQKMEPDIFKGIKNISEAENDCDVKNKTCKERLAQFKQLIEARLMDTNDWNIYENKKEKFKLKYPKDWVKIDHKQPYIGASFFDPETYREFHPSKISGAYNSPSLRLELFKNTKFFYERGSFFSLGLYKSILHGEKLRSFEIDVGPYKSNLFEKQVIIYHELNIGDGFLNIIFNNNNNLYKFSIASWKDENQMNIFKTIINSLEFET